MMKLEDLIPGGEGDNKTLSDLAKKHGVDLKHMQAQLKLGLKVEMEHTNDSKKAKELSMDHLTENPNYYTKLKKAGLADELGESATGNMSIEIGENIQTAEQSLIAVYKLTKGMEKSTKIERNLTMALQCIKVLKNKFKDVYDFEDK